MYQPICTDLFEQKEAIYRLGRTAYEGTSLVLSWSASGFYLRFKGSRVLLKTHQDEPFNVYEDGEAMPIVLRADLDGVVYKYCVCGEKGFVLIDNLPDTVHTLRLIRDSSGCDRIFCDALTVYGDDPAILPYQPSFRYKIEFIGDSITCGYGLFGTRPFFDTTEEDAAMTYAFLTGEALEADVRLISWSGKGLYRSCGGLAHPNFLDLFNAADRRESLPPYTFGDWTPDCVVINGGTNDAGHTSAACFYTAAKALYDRIREVYPHTQIVFMLGLMHNCFHETLERLQADIRTTDNRFHYLPISSIYDKEGEVGANLHPGFLGHHRGAVELTAFLQTIL